MHVHTSERIGQSLDITVDGRVVRSVRIQPPIGTGAIAIPSVSRDDAEAVTKALSARD